MTSEAYDTNATALEMETLEDLLDAAHMQLARIEQANDERIPGAMVRRLAEGAIPLTVWREHRDLSPDALAGLCGVPVATLHAIESGKEDVPLRIMSAIARALRIDLDDLVPWPNEAASDETA